MSHNAEPQCARLKRTNIYKSTQLPWLWCLLPWMCFGLIMQLMRGNSTLLLAPRTPFFELLRGGDQAERRAGQLCKVYCGIRAKNFCSTVMPSGSCNVHL
mmetsp:Transcript_62586/g.123679  ORF Transcript_62586/g.123679 Transcript_62586/m.123679 type:complete len:100 (+) Transcript_62586:515-814(+)